MPRRRLQALVLSAALAAVAAGCGDGGPEQVSAEELVAKGDALCRDGQQRFAEIQAKPLRNANDAEAQTRELIDVAEDELNELRDLEPPDELGPAYDAWLAARVSGIEVFEQGLDAAERDDDQAYVDAQTRAAAGGAKRRELAAAVGFKVCSSEPKAP